MKKILLMCMMVLGIEASTQISAQTTPPTCTTVTIPSNDATGIPIIGFNMQWAQAGCK